MTFTFNLPSLFAAPPELIFDMKTPSSVLSNGFPRCPRRPPLICIPSFSLASRTIVSSYSLIIHLFNSVFNIIRNLIIIIINFFSFDKTKWPLYFNYNVPNLYKNEIDEHRLWIK